MVQWKLVHGVCALEVTLIVLLCLPLPATWRHSIMRAIAQHPDNSPIMRVLQFMFVFLCFMLGDAALQWYKVASERQGLTAHFSHEQDHYFHMRLFRTQRNAYLSFFAIFLFFVLYRFNSMIKELVVAETMKKQVLGASRQMGDLLDQAREGEASTKKLKEAETEIDRLKRDLDTLKKQSAANNAEYDRLAGEAARLQDKADGARSNNKKDD